METPNPACPAHGPGIDPSCLVGSRLVGAMASWHVYDGEPDVEPGAGTCG
ncbi:hypothetical protein [Kitasatospora sp. NPDC101183]